MADYPKLLEQVTERIYLFTWTSARLTVTSMVYSE